MDNKNKKEKNYKKERKEKIQVKEKTQSKGSELNEQLSNAYVEIKNNAWNFSIICIIALMAVMCVYFQYKHEKQQRASRMTDEGDVDYYEVLGVEHNADLGTIRKKYKELTKTWHPDKNPGCKSCHDKFMLISKAHEILTDEAKKGELDSKGKGIFGSSPVMLNEKNYHHLVEESNDFWLVLVYENTRGNKHNQYIAEVWDEVSNRYKNIVKFGVIDVLHSENLLHFLPFKFQYYPNIITYLHGEGSELFQSIDSYSVKTLTAFIESSYVSKVNMIYDSTLSSMISNKDSEKSVANVKSEDLEIKLILVSAKNYVELVSKDFAKNYKNVVEVYQNEMGYLDKFKKILNASQEHRVFIQYNDIITPLNEQNQEVKTATTLKNVVEPIPIKFAVKSNVSRMLQRAYTLVKYLTLQRIYKNNYVKHCVNKMKENPENSDNPESDTKIDMCIILLEHSDDLNNNSINRIFYQNLISNFKKNIIKIETTKIVSNQTDEYNINVNYGITSLEKNKALKKLYNDYIEAKNIQVPKGKSKLLFIINDTQQKFTFKWFKEEDTLKEYLEDFDKSDFYEDSQFSFDYFSNYNNLEIKETFNDEKIFSIEKIFTTAIYAQMQASYIFSFLLIFLANTFYLKIEYLTLAAFGISIALNLLWQIYNSFNF